jgi:hypothetical protein
MQLACNVKGLGVKATSIQLNSEKEPQSGRVFSSLSESSRSCSCFPCPVNSLNPLLFHRVAFPLPFLPSPSVPIDIKRKFRKAKKREKEKKREKRKERKHLVEEREREREREREERG